MEPDHYTCDLGLHDPEEGGFIAITPLAIVSKIVPFDFGHMGKKEGKKKSSQPLKGTYIYTVAW